MAQVQAQTADPADPVASGLVRLMLSMEALYNRQSRRSGLTSQQAQLLCTAARRKAGLGVSVLELSPGGQAVVHSFEAELAARLGRMLAGWPAKKRETAAGTLAALIDAIQRDLAEEDQAAEAEAAAGSAR